MAVAAIIGATAALVGVGVNAWQGGKSASHAEDQLALSMRQHAISEEDRILSMDQRIFDMQSAIGDNELELESIGSQISSYDSWLNNYSSMYAQETQSKQAQTDALMASGKETYENFLNAIGYADAVAGATGRVGAGTSAAHATQMLDRKLVDYAGEDRTLDANGGLFGSQLTAANMEMDQLKIDLSNQRTQFSANKDILMRSAGHLTSANDALRQSITDTETRRDTARNDLDKFVEQNFGNKNADSNNNVKEEERKDVEFEEMLAGNTGRR